MKRSSMYVFLIVTLLAIMNLSSAQYYAPSPFQNTPQGAPGPDAIHITKIQSLTLRHREYTTHRRTSPVPQLKCVGGDAYHDSYRPQSVQCYNKGSDGNIINWKCESDMDDRFQFGRLNVQCEGYRHPGDEWVLKGSCGLEYELDYSQKGRNRKTYNYYNTYSNSNSGSSFFVVLIILVIIIVLAYKYCIAGPTHRPTSTPRTSGFYPEASVPPYNPDYMNDQHKYTTTTTDSGPGFWSGAALGAAAGYGLGRSTAPSSSYSYQPNYRSNASYSSSSKDDDDSTTRRATGFATTSSR